jgi:hypothetical protein
MADRSATALLGMDGFVVLSHTEEDGELWMLVETTDDVVGCPTCGVRAVGHGRSVVHVRPNCPVEALRPTTYTCRGWPPADGTAP